MIANKKIKKSTCHIRGVYSLPLILALEAESRQQQPKKKDYIFFKHLMNEEIGLRYFQRKQESSIPLNYYEKAEI